MRLSRLVMKLASKDGNNVFLLMIGAFFRSKQFTLFVGLLNTLLAATLIIVAMEWIARGSLNDVGNFITSLNRPGLITILAVTVLLLALDAVFARRNLSLLIIVPLALLLAAVSSQKQVYLSDPLYPSDMLFGRQIIQLLPAMIKAQPWLAGILCISIAATVAALIYLWMFTRRHTKVLTIGSRLGRLVFALPVLFGLGSLMEYSQYSWIRDRLNIIPMMWDQQENYKHNGFIMAFMFNVPMANVSAPVGYDENIIANIQSDGSAYAVNYSERPDVIFIMSESLFDPTKLEAVEFKNDPMPFIRANQSGEIFSPEFGGMTSNVEFEALTGFSNAFLPYGSIPYQQYIREPVPSLASYFRAEGYSAVAVHPFQEWFWNRKEVYKNFGFEEFKSENNLPPMEKRGVFASDEALTNEILSTVENAKKPMFLFAVTLQGHGPYEANRYANNSISFNADISSQSTESLLTYSQGVREADIEIERLMKWASERERETIVVVFGDHLPPMGQVYVETGYMPGMVATRKAPLDVMKKEHETPLVVWSNRKGVKENIGTISPALLPYHVVSAAGFSDPFYTGILGDVQKQYPVIDRHMLVNSQGEATPDWATRGSEVPSILSDYRQIQYDMMFGRQFSKERFFTGFNWLEETNKPTG